MEFTFIAILLFTIINFISRVDKLEGRIKGMQYRLDQVAKQVDVPEPPINDELRELIKEGESVRAVKQAREALGLSLVEGKQYVDALKLELED
ncbi:hypothetical protein KFZ58_12820 [Virgibacillus sp. NKC19-16]|uniref:hypothetical protein n=1 Tax=Virgibacillus salidurans TaxID=2831673 RepID=UPI001F439014|nr:hypothetical protein [Virgibacillus sp. NKC19-16]UJL45288.1 hypothetical protein KFZ58_12820 [Virgibacillus sp. NKC19-16]